MTKVQKITLFLILVLMPTLYILWSSQQEKKPIQIKPIQIAPIVIENSPKPQRVYKEESTENILLKLKIATEASQSNMNYSQEKEHEQIIINLQKTIAQQEINKKELKRKIQQKVKIAQKTPLITQKESSTKKIVPNNVREEKKKPIVTDKVPKVVKEPIITQVAELPDSHHIEVEQETQNHTPLKFVKTLGVVAVSHKYESDFTVPQKVELAKEGIINISNASVETKELQNLNFVNTLEVIEVSEDFETINAHNHLNN